MKRKKKQAGAASRKLKHRKKTAPARHHRKPEGPASRGGSEPDIPPTQLRGNHERFCQLIVSGVKATEAYRQVFGRHVKGANGNAARLIATDSISRRIAELNAAAARGVVMSKQELMEYLTRAIRTPIGEVTRKSDLCHKAKYTIVAGKDDDAQEIALVEIQTVSKIAAGEQLARLHGWLVPEKDDDTQALTKGVVDMLARIGTQTPHVAQ